MMRTIVLITLVACASSKNNPDAGTQNPDGNGQPIDGFGGPSFGDQCATSDECQAGGFCVDGSNDSNICTYGCDLGCPEGWNCRVSDVAGQLVSLCMPQKFDFCKPCSEDVQCNGGVCVQLDGEGFCLPDCPFEGSCPTGYTCNADPSGEHSGNYCVPDTGSCSCTAAQDGQVRTCETTNTAGTCYGLETCMPNNGGWTGCTATTASMETCDGLDNDCDQLIDDGVSGSACPITVAGVGTCQGVQLCTGTTTVCQGQTPTAEVCNGFDDNCSGTPDEPWPTLGTQCSPGVGACQRFGVFRCNSQGNGVECSVTMGQPAASESCNALDDDCDMMTDEGIPNLGNSCNAGIGACARQGNIVCAPGGGTQCSVTAGPTAPETCNNVDDDCNGVVDNGFKNASGIYNQNTACGSCATDCTVIYNLPNATGVCNAGTTSASCAMQCAPGAFNVDGAATNGCELVLDPAAIYVSTNDAAAVDDGSCGLGPVGTGAGNYPCQTIAHGLTRATATGRPSVRVANGIYAETVTIVAGKNLLGGHAPDNWQRNVSGTGTLITGVATIAGTNHDYTVRASSITTTTLFEGFVVVGAVNTKTRGNSYAIYVSGSSSALTIANNVVYGGRGGPGQNGGSGTAGVGGVDGVGRASNPTGYDAKVTTGTAPCEAASNNRAYANGGQRTCGTDNVSGGNGGGNQCNPRPSYNNELSGIDGITGQLGDPGLGGAAGAGADAGEDGALLRLNGGTVCAVPSSNQDYGRDGELGRDANHGTAGAGCSMSAGSVSGGHWVGATGGIGGAGGNGGGGGGGGAGGGARCAAAGDFGAGTQACQDGRDRLGGHGGGGGSGGCGGTGGTGATAGGGAFAIFITGGASAVVVTGNSLIRGEGGQGGNGGTGGNGGNGGVGAAGGTSTEFCAGAAGRGGNGGDGGHGAGGGGGCGGGSFGIFTSGIGSPNYCMAAANNTISAGSGGAGGAGGYSLINQGGAGQTGTLATCQFN